MASPPNSHLWYYIKEGILNDIEEGPFDENQLVQLAATGILKLKSKIRSPTRTKNQLIYAESVPKLALAINQFKIDSNAQKQSAKEHTRALKLQKNQQSVEKKQASSSANASYSVDEKIAAQVSGILTNGEHVIFTCAQTKPMVIKPDAAVCTGRRLIIFRPKLLGRFDFDDFLWVELSDAHLQQGFFGSTFTAIHISGVMVTLDWLPKDGAQQLYRFAQDCEERAMWARRQLKMEEAAAGAQKINIVNSGSHDKAGQPHIGIEQDDAVSKMKKLKQMLDAELISAAEYESKRQQILESI